MLCKGRADGARGALPIVLGKARLQAGGPEVSPGAKVSRVFACRR